MPRHSRNSTGSATGEEQKGSFQHHRRDHPGVAGRDLLPALRRPVIGPPGLRHLLAPPPEERSVARHHQRLALGDQVLHDQAGHRQAQVIDVPHCAGEEPARPPEPLRHPRRCRHRHHSAPPGQDHPARQRHEQPVRGPPPERRRQLLQDIPPCGRHRQARRRQHRRTLRSSGGVKAPPMLPSKMIKRKPRYRRHPRLRHQPPHRPARHDLSPLAAERISERRGSRRVIELRVDRGMAGMCRLERSSSCSITAGIMP